MLTQSLAELWAGAGNRVATGGTSRFFTFCDTAARAAGTELPERLVNAVAKTARFDSKP
jgi:hypothetical protein